MDTTLPPTIVLNPVSASRMSPLVVSNTPGPPPERIWLLATLNVELPAAEIGPKMSDVDRNIEPPASAIAGVPVEVGQNVPLRPCSVPLLMSTGMPVPLATLRKFTLSMMTPEPAPVLAMFSELAVPCE